MTPLAYALNVVGLDRVILGELFTDYGYAVYLDNVDDGITVPHTASLVFNQSITCEAWFYGSELPNPNNFKVLFKKGYAGPNPGFALTVGNTRFIFTVYNGSSGVTSVGTTVIDDTLKYHVIGRMNLTHTSLFVNGIVEDEDVIPGDFFGTIHSTSTLQLGWSARWLNGTIDELRIYSRTINQTEITYSYNSGGGIDTVLDDTDLDGWWHCNEGAGITVGDSSGNSNDGTMENPDSDEWVMGLVPIGTPVYPNYMNFSNLEQNYNVTLYNTTSLIGYDSVDVNGNASITLPLAYRYDTFESTIKILDIDNNHLFTFSYDDSRGGDVYRAIIEKGLGIGFIAMIFAIFGIVISIGLLAKKYG